MNDAERHLMTLFADAVDLVSPAERAAYLDRACGDNAVLRQEVESLLQAHARIGRFLVPQAGTAGSVTSAADKEIAQEPRDGPTTAPQTAAETPGAAIGPYKLLEQIGEGGMGTVWMAQQTEPVKRVVALKLIKAGMDSKQIIARFEAERQALALMDHANIARVLDAGATSAGRPYFVMDLVKGVPITKYCDEHHLTPRQRLELFIPVCQAVQHAHQKGIIHRDLKPSNVLVAHPPDPPLAKGGPGGVPKVIDFGVAKAAGPQLTEKTLVTGFGAIVGTLEYMSPEQAEINQLDIDTRSDIYSLGVLLYELLTGSPPFTRKELEKAGMMEMLRVIREQEPSKPSTKLSTAEGLPTLAANRGTEPAKLTKLVRGELDWIVMKALEKDRNRRYETANGFAMDVMRYLADEPVQACPPSVGYRLRKFVRRNKGPVLAAALVLAALVVGMVGTTWGMIRATQAESDWWREAQEKTTALGDKEAALATAEANEIEAKEQSALAKKQEGLAKEKEQTAKEQALLARRRLYASQINLAHQAWEAGNPARVLELLEGLRPRFDEDDLRSFEWYYLWRLCYAQRRLGLHGHTASVTGLAFSPDGKTLASAGLDLTVRLWDPIAGAQQTILRGNGTNWFSKVAFTPDGKTLVGSRWDGTIEMWDANTGQQQATLEWKAGGSIRSLAISPDGKTLAGGSCWFPGGKVTGVIRLWDIASRQELATMEGHQEVILGLAFSPDGKTLASATGWGDDRGIVILWDVETKTARFTRHKSAWCVDFSPDGTLLAACNNQGLTLFDIATGTERAAISSGLAHAVRFSPDGKTVATAGTNRTVKLWEVATGKGRTLGAHRDPAYSVAFSPDGKILASGGADGAVNLWNTEPVPAQSVLKHSAAVHTLTFAPDGKTLITGGRSSVQLWDLAAEKAVALKGPTEGIISFALSPDGKSLAVSSFEKRATPNTRAFEAKSVKVWDLATGQARGEFQSPGPVSGAAYSADGKTLATWKAEVPNEDATKIRLWDVATHKLRATLQAPNAGSIICAAFSPDGKTLVAGAHFGSFVAWDLVSRQRIDIGVDRGHSSTMAVVFSPDGKTLATAGGHGTVRLWNVERWQLQASLKGHTDTVHALAFSPDGKTLATGSLDSTVRFWDVITGQERMTLTGHTAAVMSLAFDRDGNTLASGSEDKTVRLWRTATEPDARARKTELDRDDPDSPIAQSEAANRLWQIGRPADAEQLYRKALARLEQLIATFPDEPAYRYAMVRSWGNLSLLLESTGRPKEAEHAAQQAREQWQALPADYARSLSSDSYALAKQRFDAGAFKESMDICTQGLKLYRMLSDSPKDAVYRRQLAFIHNLRGIAYNRLDDHEKALDDYIAACEQLPNDAVLWYNRASTYSRLKKHAEAAAAYRKSIAIDPKWVMAYQGLANVLQANKDLDGVIAAYRQALEALGPNHSAVPEIEGKLVAAYKNNGNVAEATRLYEQMRDRRLEKVATLGQNLLQQRQYADAESPLRECLALREKAEPDAWTTFNARSLLGAALLGQKKYADAEPQLVQGYEGMNQRDAQIPPSGKPRLLEAIERLVQLYDDWGKPEQAAPRRKLLAEQTKKAIEGDPKNGSLHLQLGITLEKLGEFDAAVLAFRRAIELTGKDKSSYRDLTLALLSLRRPDNANGRLRKDAEKTPSAATAYLVLGTIILLDHKKSDEAIACFQRAVELVPSAENFYHAGITLLENATDQRNVDRAAAFFEKGVELDSAHVQCRWGLGRARQRQKRLDDAVACFHACCKLDPNHGPAHWALGFVLLDQKKPGEAVVTFRKAVVLLPKHGYARYGLARALMELKDRPEEAIAALRECIALEPGRVDAHYRLGVLFRQQNRAAEALACFRQTIELDSKHSLAHGHLGSILAIQGKIADGMAMMRQAIKLNPKQAGSHAELAWHLATAADPKLCDPKAAVSHGRTATTLQPDLPIHWRNLGAALLRDGDHKAAAEALEKFDTMTKGGNHSHRFFLAMAYWQTGEKEKAGKAYEQAVRWLDKNQPENDEQRRFRREAAELLKRDDESKSPASK